MSTLATYLNHQLADRTRGVELAERAAAENAGTRLGTFLLLLGWELGADREALLGLMEHLNVRRKRARPAPGLPALRHHSPVDDLESLQSEIARKIEMWNALRDAVGGAAGVDFDALVTRAQEQAEALERRRRDVAGDRPAAGAVPMAAVC
jgi:hypothetical protein